MKWFRKKRLSPTEFTGGPASRSDALAYCPVKSLETLEEKTENGEVLLTYPLILRPWFLNLARRLGLGSGESMSRKLQLDEMGSLVWSFMDGNRTVQDVVDLVSRRYKLNPREAEVAMTSFLRELGRRGLVGFRPPYSKGNENIS
jgi:hypothetical protein